MSQGARQTVVALYQSCSLTRFSSGGVLSGTASWVAVGKGGWLYHV
jgi:hypothetical protein